MEFQVARLQEIVGKIQYFCKLHFKNAVDVSILLEADGLEIEDINKLISAGVRKVGFSDLEQFSAVEHLLLPCERHYLGDLETHNLMPILADFSVIESVVSLEQAREIADVNARAGRVTRVMMRLNVLSDIKKFGFLPVEINDCSYDIALMPGLRLIGVSTFVPEMGGSKLQKTAWRKVGTVFKILTERFHGFEVLSVNFSDNLADLIGESVNELRIGVKVL